MSELKSCPFCGGEAEYGLTMAGEEAYCKKCHAAMPRLTTKAEAIAAWNTRAERTCRNISGVPLKFRCSECGDVLGKPSVDEFNYCPNCGVKVVD